jgi:fused signal recognition particle receptor
MAFKWLRRKKDSPEPPEGSTEAAVPEPMPEPEFPAAPEPADEPRPTPEPDDAPAAAPAPRKGILSRLKQGLSKTREILTTDIDDLFRGRRRLDDEVLEELEELLITADLGVQTATTLIARIARQAGKIADAHQLKAQLKEEILALLPPAPPVPAVRTKPHVVMVVGVNGVGKTTTIGKLAHRYRAEGHSVLIAAGDTFRAAAVEQLTIWAERAGAEIVRHRHQADPAAVAYDAVEAALARSTDVVIVDTAGRLHTKINLMEELKKIKRSIDKKLPGAPHETLLVLDATTGQNALSQARLFHEAIDISGMALTKLDGTAKGGIVISICSSLNIPLQYIGIGEGIEDLQRFAPEPFVEALF